MEAQTISFSTGISISTVYNFAHKNVTLGFDEIRVKCLCLVTFFLAKIKVKTLLSTLGDFIIGTFKKPLRTFSAILLIKNG
jgi:hypothetical protein